MTLTLTERRDAGLGMMPFSLPRALEGGAMAGLIGGVVSALWSMAYFAISGYGLLFPFYLIGATFGGADALVGGSGVILWGLVLHIGTAIVLGVLYAFMVTPQVQNVSSLLGGVVYGMAILAAMTYVVTPWANPILHQRIALMPASWFVTHALFGLGVAVVPMLERYLGRRSLPREPPATA